MINNLLLSKCKGWTGEYWPKVVAVCAKWKEVCTKMTGGQYSSVWLKEARLVSRYYTVLGLTLLLLFFNCWHARWTLQGLWTFLWKWFLWQNPDQVRARLPLPCNNFLYLLWLVLCQWGPYRNLGVGVWPKLYNLQGSVENILEKSQPYSSP